jgi:membrane protein
MGDDCAMVSEESNEWSAVFRESVRAWSRGGARLLSGAVAFYALLSVIPVFILAIRVAGVATSEEAARAALFQNLTFWIGRGGTETVRSMLSTESTRSHGPWILEPLVLVYASTRLFAVLQKALHLLWDIPMKTPERFAMKVLTQLRRRAAGFVLVISVGAILVAMVLWNTFVVIARHHLSNIAVWRGASAGVSFALTATLFALIFKVLPEVRVSFRDAVRGGIATTVLFFVGAVLVGSYVGHKAAESFFGAASSLVALLLWVNYSAQVFFLGASFTGVYARLRGDGIQPRT